MEFRTLPIRIVSTVYDFLSTLIYLGLLITSFNFLLLSHNATGLAWFLPFAVLSCLCAVIDYVTNDDNKGIGGGSQA